MKFDPGVALGLAASALIALFLPPVLALLLHRRTGASLRYFAIGAAVLFVFQVILRLPWLELLNAALQDTLKRSVALQIAWIAFASLTAGIFEEVGRWIAYRFVVRQERSWRVGVMLGLGHGGIESILLVGVSIAVSLVLYLQITSGSSTFIPAEHIHTVREQLARVTPGLALLGGVERALVLCLQVALSLIVMQTFVRGQSRWLLMAIALHFAANFFGVLTSSRAGPFAAEAATALFALAALVIIFRLRGASES